MARTAGMALSCAGAGWRMAGDPAGAAPRHPHRHGQVVVPHIERWIALYGSPNPVVRRRAVAALCKVADPRALPVLLDAFAREGWLETAVALKHSRSPALVEPLIRCLAAPDPWMRESACEILGALGDRRATAPLLELLHDDHIAVRRAAAFALGALGDPAAIGPLQRRYRDRPEDNINVRMGLFAALKALGAPPEVPWYQGE